MGVPKTIMSGKTANIRQFCELEWYEIKVQSTAVSFPEDLLVLTKYLGLSINVGPAMTAKILTPMGNVVHCSMYRPLTFEDPAYPVKKDCKKAILWIAEYWWGSHLAKSQLDVEWPP